MIPAATMISTIARREVALSGSKWRDESRLKYEGIKTRAKSHPASMIRSHQSAMVVCRCNQVPPEKIRTYAVGVLAGARGPAAPANLLFPPTCGGNAATGGWKKKGVLWRALPSKPPNRVTPKDIAQYVVRRSCFYALHTTQCVVSAHK